MNPESTSIQNTTQPIQEKTKWREDFPVDVPLDSYISRREFVKFLVMISGAFTLGQFWIAFMTYTRKHAGPALTQKIAGINDIPVGGYLAFHYPDHRTTCLLIRLEENQFVAYDNRCTHLMCPVIPQVEKKELFCPCHKGHFNLADGRPIAGPPRRPLAKVRLQIKGGDIYATGLEAATL
ncbi:MAG: aioB [Vampirovibrio sp.]|jgi:Rieske Fe-S protein|nr:aioB [Vampirovibrio sp.]